MTFELTKNVNAVECMDITVFMHYIQKSIPKRGGSIESIDTIDSIDV